RAAAALRARGRACRRWPGGARAGGGGRERRARGHGAARRAGGRLLRAALGAGTRQRIAGIIPARAGRETTSRLMSSSPIRVVLADDHALVRAGIRSLLGAMHDVQVVGEAASGEEALQLAERERPDVILMDIAMN